MYFIILYVSKINHTFLKSLTSQESNNQYIILQFPFLRASNLIHTRTPLAWSMVTLNTVFLKELCHDLHILKKFQVRRLLSMLMICTLHHPCCFMIYCLLFRAFLLVNNCIQLFFNLKMILYTGKITQP